jgi:outer membrane protein OmpA-like peptidoglycan-associated protein
MSIRSLYVASAILFGIASPAFAQKAGTVELGGFGRYTKFDSDLNFDNKFGFGGRLGIFLVSNLAIEGDASYTQTHSSGGNSLKAIPVHARLVFNVPLGGLGALLLGGGYTRQLFRSAYRETTSGVGGLAGFRIGTGSVVSFRAEATGDYIPNAESRFASPQLAGITQTKSNLHWGGQAGLSLLLGAKRNYDKDRDGVPNRVDKCPSTPLGDRVDAAGCTLPKDEDHDGVVDAQDKCPGTPSGTKVDATGCSQDGDGDGVIDVQDKCPNTPAGTEVNASGCPRDSDADGVLDPQDKCPNTPAGTPVDATGCPKDSDHDGVTDTLDKCPNTPAGTTVDETGCPRDADGDGVGNLADKCPGTPTGLKVDATGCPALFAAGPKLVLENVTFATGKSTLLPESMVTLDRVAASLNNLPNVNVEVSGHTDSKGGRALNLRLSDARAKSVRDYLISKGVDGTRITAKGYGPDKPLQSNATVGGRAANRRVELSKTN